MLSETERSRRAFSRAHFALTHNREIEARTIGKSATPIEIREARLDEKDRRSAFVDAYRDLHRGRKRVTKSARITDDVDRTVEKVALDERRRVTDAIVAIHRGKPVKVPTASDHIIEKVHKTPMWRFI
jgi:hypothetical protein